MLLMKKISILTFIILTIIILYVGLFDELFNRYKFNQWDIIGNKGRVTNHNLFSNLYLFLVLLYLFFYLLVKLKNRYLKSKNE